MRNTKRTLLLLAKAAMLAISSLSINSCGWLLDLFGEELDNSTDCYHAYFVNGTTSELSIVIENPTKYKDTITVHPSDTVLFRLIYDDRTMIIPEILEAWQSEGYNERDPFLALMGYRYNLSLKSFKSDINSISVIDNSSDCRIYHWSFDDFKTDPSSIFNESNWTYVEPDKTQNTEIPEHKWYYIIL